MKILTLDLKNWMKVSEAHFIFDDGINVLFGDNGEGKTSVFEAIAFLLTDHKRAESWKDYIKGGTKGFDITMTLQMSQDQDDIMELSCIGLKSKGSVERTVKYKKDEHKGASASDFLKRTFDQDMLENTAFAFGDGDPITKMQPAKRREIFKKIFKSDFVDTLARIQFDKTKADTDVIQTKTKLGVLQSATYPLKRIIEVDETELDTLKQELQESQATELEKEKFKLYSEKVKQLKNAQAELIKLISDKERQQGVLKSFMSDSDELDNDISKLKEDIAELDEKIKQQKEIVEKHKQDKKDFVEGEKAFDVTVCDTINKEFIEEKAGHMANIQMLKKNIKAYEKGICDNCGQKCEVDGIPALQVALSVVESSLNDVNRLIDENREALKAYTAKVQEWTTIIFDEQHELDTSMNRVENYKTRLQGKVKLRDSSEATQDRQQALIDSLDTNIIVTNDKVSTLQEWCENNKVEIKSDVRPVRDIQVEIDSILQQVNQNAIQTKLNEELLKKRTSDQEEAAKLTLVLNEQQLRVTNLDTVKKIFEIDFPGYVNFQACQILEDYMNLFFRGVKTDFQIQLKQDAKGINFFYKAADEPEWGNTKMTSGFESSLLTLGFKCAVGFAYGNEFVILDEPDARASEENAMKFFETLTNVTDFKQIFTVTHRRSAKEFLVENGAIIYEVIKGVFTKGA